MCERALCTWRARYRSLHGNGGKPCGIKRRACCDAVGNFESHGNVCSWGKPNQPRRLSASRGQHCIRSHVTVRIEQLLARSDINRIGTCARGKPRILPGVSALPHWHCQARVAHRHIVLIVNDATEGAKHAEWMATRTLFCIPHFDRYICPRPFRHSGVAQWLAVGLITQRSVDRNHAPLSSKGGVLTGEYRREDTQLI